MDKKLWWSLRTAQKLLTEYCFGQWLILCKQLGLPYCIINWYKFVFENRKVLAEVQGQKYVAYPTKGTPQGGVFNPLIWILFMNSILTKFTKGAVHTEDMPMISYCTGISMGKDKLELFPSKLSMVWV